MVLSPSRGQRISDDRSGAGRAHLGARSDTGDARRPACRPPAAQPSGRGPRVQQAYCRDSGKPTVIGVSRIREVLRPDQARAKGHRAVEARFPVADAGTGRLWTLRLEQVDGRPGLWPNPSAADAIEVESSFDQALVTAWRWACRTEAGTNRLCVRWQVLRDRGDPRALDDSVGATGASVGAAAAVGLTYLLRLDGGHRRIDPRSALSATVDDQGRLGSVSGLPAKLSRGGRDWRRLIVCNDDQQTAEHAVRGDLLKVLAAGDVLEAAKLVARPRLSRPTAFTAAIVVVLALALASWYFIGAAASAGRASSASVSEAQASHLASLADKLAGSEPPTALRLAVSAFKFDPRSVDAKASLIQLTQADPRIISYLGSSGEPAVTRLAGSASGRLVVSADARGTVRSWRPGCEGCSPLVLSRGASVTAIAVAVDGSLVAVARGNRITLTTATGQLATGWPAGDLHVAGNLETLAINTDATQVAAGTSGGDVYVWTRGRRVPEHAVVHGAGSISAEIFLPDGRLVTGTTAAQTPSAQDLSVWRTEAGHLVRRKLLPPAATVALAIPGIDALAVVGNDLVIGETFLDVRPLSSLNKRRKIQLYAHVDALTSLDRTHVLVGTTAALVVGGPSSAPPTSFLDTDISTGRRQESAFSASLTCLTSAVALGPGHTVLTGTSAGVLAQWSPAPRPGSEVLRVVPDPLDRDGVVVSRQSGSVDALDAASDRLTTLIRAGRHGPATALAAKGADIFVGYTDGTVLRLTRRRGAVPVTLLRLREQVLSLAVDPAGTTLAAGGTSGLVQLFDATSGKLVRTLPHPHHGNVFAIAFDPAGRLVASSDVKDEVLVQRTDGAATQSVALLSVGLLAWLPHEQLIAGDGLGSLYRLRLPLPVHPSPIAHPDTHNILGGSLDAARRLLVLASADKSAVLFDVRADRPLGKFATLDADRSKSGAFAAAAWDASFTPDGRYAVFGTAAGHLQILTADTARLAAKACAMTRSAPVASGALSRVDLHAAMMACP